MLFVGDLGARRQASVHSFSNEGLSNNLQPIFSSWERWQAGNFVSYPATLDSLLLKLLRLQSGGPRVSE